MKYSKQEAAVGNLEGANSCEISRVRCSYKDVRDFWESVTYYHFFGWEVGACLRQEQVADGSRVNTGTFAKMTSDFSLALGSY